MLSDNFSCGYSTVLLAMLPLEDRKHPGALENYVYASFIRFVVENVFKKSHDNVVAIIGENSNANRALARNYFGL